MELRIRHYGCHDEGSIPSRGTKLNINIKLLYMFKCKYCNKEFDNKHKLGGHIIHCKLNPNYEKNLKQLEEARKHINYDKLNNQNLYLHCRFCNKEISNKGCLVIHEKACKKNPNREKCPNRKGNGGNTKGYSAWNKGLTKETDERIKKRTETWLKNVKEGKTNVIGRPHTEETKQKLRKIFKEKVENQIGPFKCFYNKKACKYIDKLNEEKCWNLQHAENGGEVECLGYFLDGYDKDLNIVFEYDEEQHYKDKEHNILNDKDIQRQQNIINKLHCEFWRYNEYLDLLYKIN